jgi:hypothetical protein
MANQGISVGNLYVELGLDAKNLKAAIGEIRGALAPIGRMATTVAGVATAAFLGTAGAIAAVTKTVYDQVEAQWKLAGQLGTTVQSLQVLQQVAKDDGIAVEGLTKGLGIMNVRLAEAARTAKGPAYDALNRVGLSAKALLAMPIEQRLIAIAGAFQTAGLSTAQQAAAMRELGFRGQDVLTILEGGGKKIKEAVEELDKFGIGLSEVDASAIVIAGNTFDDLAKAIDGIKIRLGVELAPLVAYLGKLFGDWIREQGGFKTVIASWVQAGIVGIGMIVDVTRDLIARWEELKSKGMALVSMSQGLALFAYAPMQGLKKVAEGLNAWDAAAAKAKETTAKPPSYEPWLKRFQDFQSGFTAEAEKGAKDREKLINKPGANGLPGLSGEEAKAQEEKLNAFKLGLANEAAALALHHEKQLAELEDFRKKGIAVGARYDELKAQVDAEARKKADDFRWTTFEEGLATELEQMDRKNAILHQKLTEAIAANVYSEQEGAEMRRRIIEKEHLDRLQIMANSWSQAGSIIGNALSHISGLMEDEGEKGFTVMKGLAMAAAAVQQVGAIIAAYKTGNELGGPAVGAVFAGIATAATAAMLAKMAGLGPKSKSGASAGGSASGGGGSGRGRGGSGSAAAPAPAQSMVVSGFNANEWLKGDAVRTIVKQIVKFQNDGGKVIIQ